MAKLLPALLGCILAVALVTAVTSETVKSLLAARLERKFDFQFKGIDFVGRLYGASDSAKSGSCMHAGLVTIKAIKKDQADRKLFKPIPYVADIYVCLNEQGVLELRPLTVVYSYSHSTGVVMSESFWKTCGIKGSGPSDAERTELGNIILASLNALGQS